MQITDKIATLCGLIAEVSANVETSEELKKGQKFLLIQQLEGALKPLLKFQDEIKKEIAEIATETPHTFEGAEIFKKIVYPKPSLDAGKLEADLIRAYEAIGTTYNQSMYVKESTPRVTVVIQSILDK